jgi:hypothetical protein
VNPMCIFCRQIVEVHQEVSKNSLSHLLRSLIGTSNARRIDIGVRYFEASNKKNPHCALMKAPR